MNADSIKASYARACKETVIIRRFAPGSTGGNRPSFDAPVRGRAATYGSDEIIGSILQGDWRVVVLAEDIIARGIALPLTTADKVKVKGKPAEMSIQVPNERKALDGTLVAYELQCR